METKTIAVGRGNQITISWRDLDMAGLDMDQDFYILKSKKTANTLLVVPIDNKFDEEKFEIVNTICKFSSDPLVFDVEGKMDVKEHDLVKLDIGDFGIFVTKEY